MRRTEKSAKGLGGKSKEGPPTSHERAQLSVWSSATPCGDLIPSVLILPPLLPHPPPLLLLLLAGALLSSTGINLGRLHLYLMLPISRLIPSAYSLPPLAPPCFSLLSLLAERPTTRQDRARGTTRRTSLVHPVNPGRGRGEFIVPSVMDSHDAVRHRRDRKSVV